MARPLCRLWESSLLHRMLAALSILLCLSACSSGRDLASQDFKQIRVGDSKHRVLALLGSPAWDHEFCAAVTNPDKIRERATGGCGRSWVYGSILDEKAELLIGPDGRVRSVTIFGLSPSDIADAAAETPAPAASTYHDEDYALYPIRAAAVYFVEEYNNDHGTDWEALGPDPSSLAPRCDVLLQMRWAAADGRRDGPAVEVSCDRTVAGSPIPRWRVEVPVVAHR